MKQSEIKPGGVYFAKVSGVVVKVRVDAIRDGSAGYLRGTRTFFDVTNLKTGRQTTFRSAAKFRGPVVDTPEEDKRSAEARLLREQIGREVG